MKIVVFGASGRTGRKVVWQALAVGHQVTAFVRDPAWLGIQDPHLVMAQGDVMDSDAV